MESSLLILVAGCLGAIGTFQLQKTGINVIVASCVVGLVGELIGHLLNNEDLAMVIFAGSFVGMTTASFVSLPIILVAGFICGGLYLISAPLFDGFGGKLGALAFISVLVVFLIFTLFDPKISA